ncbi:Glutamine--fructose-6-phosphate aminotransferase [isomerizing] [Candidatus Lokiarchaeum ossiferum]|uniref:Glutamine--fructose-6-phosphate aminotransferase [isomerizing] n=1 Tax=Candidatus Lokiarchaeum ossiferum TaxID=2951803 RepID=A0ABY6HT96_9ARCH|nr:Glutamine--fructose-6-phosphate aminotransferase [isomerizing] [Candidatus Lokiarchaeum sp. B-35]
MNEFLEEILSQGLALQRTLDFITDNMNVIFGAIKNLVQKKSISRFVFTGMGSSYFSCYVPYYMLKQKGINVEMLDSGEFLLHGFPENPDVIFQNTCIIMISQSGESGEIVELLKKFQSLKIKPLIIGVTNMPESYLATFSDKQLYLNAGSEKTVTSKTYVCSLLILYFFAKTIIFENFSDEIYLKEIAAVINNVSQLLPSTHSSQLSHSLKNKSPIIQEFEKKFGNDYKFIQIMARGPSLSTAYQAALNFKEIVKIKSEASSLSTFRHGGIECLTEDSKLIIISSSTINHKLDNHFIRNLIDKWCFGSIFYITTQELNLIDEEIRTHPKIMVYSNKTQGTFLAPIVEIITLQLIVYNTAVQRELIPGIFRFTQKITRGL